VIEREPVARLKIHKDVLNFLRTTFLDENGVRKLDSLIDIPDWEKEVLLKKQDQEKGKVLSNPPPHLALTSDPAAPPQQQPSAPEQYVSFESSASAHNAMEDAVQHEQVDSNMLTPGDHNEL
jgi:hypothetical protein